MMKPPIKKAYIKWGLEKGKRARKTSEEEKKAGTKVCHAAKEAHQI